MMPRCFSMRIPNLCVRTYLNNTQGDGFRHKISYQLGHLIYYTIKKMSIHIFYIRYYFIRLNHRIPELWPQHRCEKVLANRYMMLRAIPRTSVQSYIYFHIIGFKKNTKSLHTCHILVMWMDCAYLTL